MDGGSARLARTFFFLSTTASSVGQTTTVAAPRKATVAAGVVSSETDCDGDGGDVGRGGGDIGGSGHPFVEGSETTIGTQRW